MNSHAPPPRWRSRSCIGGKAGNPSSASSWSPFRPHRRELRRSRERPFAPGVGGQRSPALDRERGLLRAGPHPYSLGEQAPRPKADAGPGDASITTRFATTPPRTAMVAKPRSSIADARAHAGAHLAIARASAAEKAITTSAAARASGEGLPSGTVTSTKDAYSAIAVTARPAEVTVSQCSATVSRVARVMCRPSPSRATSARRCRRSARGSRPGSAGTRG